MFLKCLILILNLFVVLINCYTNNNDYCALEKYCAHNRKHVGCTESEFNYTSPFQVQRMTKEYRELILNEINQFRDDIALGKIHSDVFNATVSNMRILRWNHELEMLTEFMIYKIHDKEFGCIATNVSHDPRQMRFTNYYLVTPDTNVMELNKRFLVDSLRRYISSAVIELKSPKTKLYEKSGIYNARTTSIGCSFASLLQSEQQSMRYTLRCAYYARHIDSAHKAILYGKPCSKCSIFYEKCDELYPGLCVPLLKREINFHYIGTNDSLPRISIVNNENDKQESTQIVKPRYMNDKYVRGAKDYEQIRGNYKIQPPQQYSMQMEKTIPKQEIVCYNCTIQMYYNSNTNGNTNLEADNLLN